MATKAGMSLVELLVVTAVLAIVLSIAALNGRQVLLSQEQRAFLRTLQDVFWQGATEAAARGEPLILYRRGNRLELLRNTQVLRVWDIPQGVSVSLNEGNIVRFAPPGKLETPDGGVLSSPLTFTVSVRSHTYTYRVSLIGEVKVQP